MRRGNQRGEGERGEGGWRGISLKSESPIQVNFLETGMTSCDLSPMRDNGPGTVQYALMHSSLCQTLLKKILLTIRLTINSVLKPFEAK